MQMRIRGSTGVKVRPLCLGGMMFGAWGNPDHDESVRIIHRALDAGINFVDTADVYSAGESEEIVGKALEGSRRDGVVLATKANGRMGKDVNARGNSRRWIIRECENSLRRLRTDRIDLYQIHRPDPLADIDETLGALTDLIRSGKVCYAGSSTFLPSQIVEGPVGRAAPRPGALRLRAAAVLDARAGRRGRGAARLPAVRDGPDPLQPARRGLADRPVPQGRRAAGQPEGRPDPAALRHDPAGQPGQARGGRAAGPAPGEGRPGPEPPRAGLRGQPPGR